MRLQEGKAIGVKARSVVIIEAEAIRNVVETMTRVFVSTTVSSFIGVLVKAMEGNNNGRRKNVAPSRAVKYVKTLKRMIYIHHSLRILHMVPSLTRIIIDYPHAKMQ